MHLLTLLLGIRFAAAAPVVDPAPAADPAATPEPAASTAPPAEAPLALPVASVAEPVAEPPPAPSARALYLDALTAWQRRNFPQALLLSTQAVNADPLLAEAWLLRSYAEARAHDRTRAIQAVRLARESSRVDVRAAARAFEARLIDPYVRSAPSLWFGLGPQVELRYGQVVPHVGVNLGAGVPVLPKWSARAEVRWTAMDAGTLGVAGARASALAAYTLPIANGRWSFTPALGPSMWIATGQYWDDGAQVYLGARLDLDLDARLTPAFGVFVAGGTEVYPGQLAELSWLAQPAEVRTGLRFWFSGVPDAQR